jgi:replicative DNA helicase
VALLYKPSGGEAYDPDKLGLELDALPVNLPIAKQRNGPTGDVALTFFKAYTRFESPAESAPTTCQNDRPG